MVFRSRTDTTRLDRRRLMAAAAAVLCPRLPPAAAQSDAVLSGDDGFDARTREAVETGLRYLVDRQNDDGSFGRGASGYTRNVAVCSLCAMAMLAAGSTPRRGPYGASIHLAIDFLLDATENSGFIHHPEGASRGPMYGHGFSTLFLAEVYGTLRKNGLRDKLSRAVQLIVDTQNDQGGWRYLPQRSEADISVTACQMVALRAARNAGLYVPDPTMEAAVQYLRRCQNDDGGFEYIAGQGGLSDFPRSAAAIVALYSAGIYEGQEIEAGLRYLMGFPPRPRELGEQDYYMYGHYYAAQAMWHAGGQYWKSWYPAVRDALLKQRTPQGIWSDLISPEYGTAMACLVLLLPRNYLPIFRK